MTDRDKPRRPGPTAERAEREQRLAQALRDNLRRRKEQARGKAGGPAAAAGGKGHADGNKRGG